MTFGEAITSVLSQYARFSGRARRSEYWYFILFEIMISVALGLVLGMIGAKESVIDSVSGLLSLALLLPGLSVTWRRLHDIGKSGANYFWIFLPVFGQILLLIWVCRAGETGPNRYGPDPKHPEPTYGGEERAPWEY